jgi:diaminohydroxyphosphoribosylaminopyrimidine deaminase/5-amino-6-(5-phosphoribosylamino)uracil reductase
LIDPAGLDRLMERALALAERAGGATAPNPMVGCVIADAHGRILGEGFHHRAGEPHAEILALAMAREAGRDVRGSTVVVSLEPCAHHGRTPPCVDALVAAGVGRVVYGVEDPAAGKDGAARLASAGIPADTNVRRREAELLVEPWLHFVRTRRPFFHLKSAITLNGRVTRGAGGPRRITGEAAERAVHRLRRRYPAIVIGIGTALADDPLLTARAWPPADDDATPPWPDVQPLRVVLDSRLRLPLDSRLVSTAGESPVLVVAGEDADPARVAALAGRGVEVLGAKAGASGLDLRAVAGALADRGVTGALVEPGPTLASGFLGAGLADRWTFFIAPIYDPADDALPLSLGDGDPLGLDDPVWEPHGPDVSVSGRPR